MLNLQNSSLPKSKRNRINKRKKISDLQLTSPVVCISGRKSTLYPSLPVCLKRYEHKYYLLTTGDGIMTFLLKIFLIKIRLLYLYHIVCLSVCL